MDVDTRYTRCEATAPATPREARFASFRVPFFSLAISAWAINCIAQSPANVARNEAELRARLQQRTTISLAGSEIRNAAAAIAKNNDLAIAFDRRIDPELPVELSATDTTIEEVWRRLAESHDLGYTTFGPNVYVGPKQPARDLSTLAALRRDEVERFPAALKAKLLHADSTTCEAPCDAGALWNRLTAEAGLTFVNPARMPFDLWPTVGWAPLPLVDRLTLVASQFDLTFRIDPLARTITLEPAPNDAMLERSYAAGLKPLETLNRFRTIAPSATIRQVGAKMMVVGKYEDHQRLAGRAPAAVANNVNAPPPAGAQVFTLRVKDVPLGELIRVLREKHKLKIQVDEAAIKAAGLSLDGRTEVDVAKATLQQLLEQAAAPLGLTARTVGEAVEIGVRPAAPK